MERDLIWQLSVSQASRRQFLDSKKILRSLQLSKSRISSCLLEGPVKRLDAHQCSRRFWTAQHRQHATVQTLFSIREDFEQLSTRLMKTACNRPDPRATPSRRRDWILMKKCVKRVIEVGCCLPSGCPLSKFGHRQENSASVLY